MRDFNNTNDPALIQREDLVKRLGPGHVDYAYQRVQTIKQKIPPFQRLKEPELRKALGMIGLKTKSA